jgi:amidophosphoribosyltransferase
MAYVMRRAQGAYCLTVLTKDGVIAVRDPLGMRPLSLARIDGGFCFASETCAFDHLGATFIRDIEPGETLLIDHEGLHSYRIKDREKEAFCVFEYIYFARPDSNVESRNVYDVRKRIGAELARESHVPADIIIPVPDSGVPAAIGYANEAKLPFELGIIRNHYVGRTFIEPTDQIRNLGVKLKHNANRANIKGKRVILVDDSIVRGTTSTKIVAMVRQAGAAEVHMRISSPPTTNSCFYGIATPERDKLLASHMSIQEMGKYIGADSLAFLSIDGLYRAVGEHERDARAPQFCDACFTGEYPIPLVDHEAGKVSTQLSLLTETV